MSWGICVEELMICPYAWTPSCLAWSFCILLLPTSSCYFSLLCFMMLTSTNDLGSRRNDSRIWCHRFSLFCLCACFLASFALLLLILSLCFFPRFLWWPILSVGFAFGQESLSGCPSKPASALSILLSYFVAVLHPCRVRYNRLRGWVDLRCCALMPLWICLHCTSQVSTRAWLQLGGVLSHILSYLNCRILL